MEDFQMSDGSREMTGSDTETEETQWRKTTQVATVGLSKAREALKAIQESKVQEESSVEEIKEWVFQLSERIGVLALKSGNTKPKYAKEMKAAARDIKELAEYLPLQNQTEEIIRLKAKCTRVRMRLEESKKEMEVLKRKLLAQSDNGAEGLTEVLKSFGKDLKSEIMHSTEELLKKKLANIENRLLPKQLKSKSDQTVVDQSIMTLDLQTSPEGTTRPDCWASVVSRKGNKKIVQHEVVPPKGGALLTVPRSAAVLVTLEKEAEENGVTYAEVIKKARKSVALPELGISHINIRRAAAGGRLIEIEGEAYEEKADLLASKLKAALLTMARVSRPEKMVCLRVKGLDDAVTAEDVIAALSKKANCAADLIRCKDIERRYRIRSVLVHCPVAIAKIILEGECIIGWSLVEVVLLKLPPLRCYKCLELGHTRASCTSTEDRSNVCYRCGKAGHKSVRCDEAPHCVICASENMAANHVLGARNCNPTVKTSQAMSM
ncbi:uncharacterized protein LOC123690686 [Pieris rapae]|uniref:uncharacterized protein LOC123690686 n=1 Tax=Pieris rapae TaxID=64459 RepID=UPI001E27B2AF|nr:uncharacterized protein LOC123690686 [Pieris rapae]